MGPACCMDFVRARLRQPQSNNMDKCWVLGMFVEKYWWGRNHPLSTRQDKHKPKRCANYEVHKLLKTAQYFAATLHVCYASMVLPIPRQTGQHACLFRN